MGINPDALFQRLQLDLILSDNRGDISTFAADLLSSSFLKKFEDTSAEADRACLAKFLAVNEFCKNFEVIEPSSFCDEQIDCEVRHFLDRFSLSPTMDLEKYDFGPGASNGLRGKSFPTKVGTTLTATSQYIYGMYIDLIRHYPTWLHVERERYSRFGKCAIVPYSKLCFVPKNRSISRSIAVEPSLNMFIQKGVGRQLEDLLRLHCHLDIEDQQFRNRRLARIGSADKSYSTIDLSSASDSISLEFCRKFLPAELFATLDAIRCTHTVCNGASIELHMISTMGNATTFPLQTLIFTSIVRAAYIVHGIPFRLNHKEQDGNFGVFGDDIICHPSAYNTIVTTLNRYGFSINLEKSFTGFSDFRESCGGDYYKGHNVRPVYCRSLHHPSDIYSLINRLIIWSSRHQIELFNTVSYLASFVKERPVPIYEDVSSGVRTALPKTFTVKTGLYTYRPLRFKCTSLELDDHFDTLAKKHNLPPQGEVMYLSFLKGVVRDGRVFSPSRKDRFAQVFVATPIWWHIDRSNLLLEDIHDTTYKHWLITYAKVLEGSYLHSARLSNNERSIAWD